MLNPTGLLPRMMTVTTTLTTTRTTQQPVWWASTEPCDDHIITEDSGIPCIDRKGASSSIYDGSPSTDSTSVFQDLAVTQEPLPSPQPAASIETSILSLDPTSNDASSVQAPGEFRPPVSKPSQPGLTQDALTSIMPSTSVASPLSAASAFPDTQLESTAPASAPSAPLNEATPITLPPSSTVASDSPLGSVETTTVGPAVQPDPTASPAANLTQSSSPAPQDAKDQDIVLPVGAFATILALAGLFSVVFLILAIAACRRRRKRQGEAQREVNDPPSTGTFTPLKSQSQRDSGHGSTLETGTTDKGEDTGRQTLAVTENVRLSIFPGWPKRIAQLVSGRGKRREHVNFEMVTGDQAAR